MEDLAKAAIAQNEPIVGVVEREPFRDALDRVNQPGARLGDFPQILLVDLERGISTRRERLRHPVDLVLVARERIALSHSITSSAQSGASTHELSPGAGAG